MFVQRVVRSRCADTCLCFPCRGEGDCLHKNPKEELLTSAKKRADPPELDSAEGLESTYPHPKKHVRTAKSAHMERQARTHSPWSNSLGSLGVAEKERPLLN